MTDYAYFVELQAVCRKTYARLGETPPATMSLPFTAILGKPRAAAAPPVQQAPALSPAETYVKAYCAARAAAVTARPTDSRERAVANMRRQLGLGG